MDQHNYEPFNWWQPQQHLPAPVPVPEPADYHYAPTSPSDFIYNSANTTSIFRPFRPSRPSCSLVTNESASTSPSPPAYYPPVPMGYGPSRPVEQSYPTYLSGPSLPESSLPEPTPGLAEHRRQRQREPKMNMGPGPSKSVPPPLSLGSNRGGDKGSDSGESIVVIKQEEGSSSPVLVSMPMMKKWEPREPTEGPGQQIKVDGKGREREMFDPFGNTPEVEMEMGNENRMGSEIGSGSGTGIWEERGEGVMERVIPPMVSNIGMAMDMGMEPGIEGDMGMGMQPTIMPKMGLFKPIRWDGPSSSSASKSSRSSKAKKARRARAWEVETVEEGGNDVHRQRTYARQNQNRNENRNRNNNEKTEDEQPITAPISSSSHSRSPKRLKTSPSGFAFRSNSASAEKETETETAVTVKIKQEPGLSPSPSAIFAQIPMYSHPSTDNSGYETAGQDGNPPSSRSISPLTRVPTPRRLLFPTSNRSSTSTGTNSQLSLRGVSKQLKKRNWVMALDRDWEESREESRGLSQEGSRERRGEGFWSLAGGGGGSQAQGRNTTAAQDEEIREWASPRQQQQQQQYRGSSEEKEEEGWTTISGSSEEGEASSHYENSYSCGQERDRNNAPGNTHQSSPFLPYGDQEWCHPFSSSSASASRAPVPGSSSSARYGPGSVPSLSASQEREEQYRQAIQMVKDTCLEASKRYIRAHCVNRGARGGGDSPGTSTLSHETAENRTTRKARRKRKLETLHAFCSSSIFSSSSPSPPPSRRRRRNRKRTTITPPSSPSSSQFHDSITCTDSLLPNISQICTLLWSRSQSLRLHDIDSIELHTARNMYWLLSWAETVAFAVPPTPTASIPDPDSTSGRTSVGSSFPGFGVSSLENLAASGRGQWNRPSASCSRRERDWGVEHAISPWENFGEELNEEGYMWRRRNSEEGGGFEMLESRNGAVWEQQREEMKRVFEEGGMLCEFLGYGEGVERIARVRGFYGF